MVNPCGVAYLGAESSLRAKGASPAGVLWSAHRSVLPPFSPPFSWLTPHYSIVLHMPSNTTHISDLARWGVVLSIESTQPGRGPAYSCSLPPCESHWVHAGISFKHGAALRHPAPAERTPFGERDRKLVGCLRRATRSPPAVPNFRSNDCSPGKLRVSAA